ncbi:MAG: hypothetical protein ACK501_23525 [Planctomycetota bacterium]|jgi:hypothetical protein
MRKNVLLASLACIGLAGMLLWGWPEAGDSAPPMPSPSLAEHSAQTPPAGAHPVGSPFERIAVAESPPSIAPPPDALRRLRRAVSDGAVSNPDLQLPDAATWDQFTTLWDEHSILVRRAEDRRDDVAKKLSMAKFAKGECRRIPADGLQTSENGHTKPIGAWREKRHPHEWVSNRVSYREGEGQLFEQVRIMPGEDPELDSANGELESAVGMRTEAVKRFLAQFAGAPPDRPSGH